MNELTIPAQNTKGFSLRKQTVSWKKETKLLQEKLGEDYEIFLSLHKLAQKKPKKSLFDMKLFQRKYPDVPEVNNLLAYNYIARKRVEKADALTKENYLKNPKHLLSQINWAHISLRRKNLSIIDEIFDGKTDLRDICPGRKTFYIAEFEGFMTLMGYYHLALGKRQEAECYHYLAHKIAPKSFGTRILGRKLYHTPFYRKVLKLLRIK